MTLVNNTVFYNWNLPREKNLNVSPFFPLKPQLIRIQKFKKKFTKLPLTSLSFLNVFLFLCLSTIIWICITYFGELIIFPVWTNHSSFCIQTLFFKFFFYLKYYCTKSLIGIFLHRLFQIENAVLCSDMYLVH